MDQGHCPSWSALRQGLDLTNIMDLMVFFRNLLKERAKMDAEDVFRKTASHDS